MTKMNKLCNLIKGIILFLDSLGASFKGAAVVLLVLGTFLNRLARDKNWDPEGLSLGAAVLPSSRERSGYSFKGGRKMERQEQWQGAEDLVEGGLLCPVILSAKPLLSLITHWSVHQIPEKAGLSRKLPRGSVVGLGCKSVLRHMEIGMEIRVTGQK